MLPFGERTFVMGVLNVTPDSFSDGGRLLAEAGGDPAAIVEAALEAAAALAAAGADVIDVGGESTRPGASPVSEEEELARVVPVIARLAERLAVPLSIDTYKGRVAEAALEAGARIVNDVTGGTADPAIRRVAARRDAAYVAGHLRGGLADVGRAGAFEDVVAEVGSELAALAGAAEADGVRQVWVDPGLGFGKGTASNLALLARLSELKAACGARPLVVGPSRKRFIGELTGQPVDRRAFGTTVAATVAVLGGGDVVRLHDVAEIAPALRLADALRRAR